jgi:hypothetical protein
MKHTTTLAAMAIAMVAATALPLDSALAGDGGHKGQKHQSHGKKGGYYSKHYRGHRHHGHHRGHHKHHRHHGHHHRPSYGYARPWGCGSNLGFLYDSWTDSFRVGGTSCFY